MSFLIDDKFPPLFFDDELFEDKNEGFEGAEGFEDEPFALVAIAVGKTHDGASLPAKPSLVNPVPLSEIKYNNRFVSKQDFYVMNKFNIQNNIPITTAGVLTLAIFIKIIS